MVVDESLGSQDERKDANGVEIGSKIGVTYNALGLNTFWVIRI